MVETLDVRIAKAPNAGMRNLCEDLFRKWLCDLDCQEKEIWLWNALVDMKRIEQRRGF